MKKNRFPMSPRTISLRCAAKARQCDHAFACTPITAIAMPATAENPLPTEIVWMPAGEHEISAGTMDGKGWTGTLLCDETSARNVMESFSRVLRAGLRVWLDRDHDDGEAAAWIKSFSWDAARGIVAAVEWTALGAQLLREKRFYSFSPAFRLDKSTGRIAGLIEGHSAGGLVNAPAFGAAMPALAARLGGTATSHANPAADGSSALLTSTADDHMKELLLRILAALGVSVPDNATDEALQALVAEHSVKAKNLASAQTQLTALQAELSELKAKATTPEHTAALAALKKQVEGLELLAAAERKKNAQALVKAAVERGALKEDDTALHAKWAALIEANEAHADLLAALPGKAKAAAIIVAPDVTQMKRGGAIVTEVRAGLVDALKAMAAKSKAEHLERGQIFCASINPVLAQMGTREFGLVLAANSLGTLSGDLIVLRALTLLKQTFPMLTAISTDFSSEGAKFNQQIVSKILSIPASADYVPGTGYATADAFEVDVPVTISNHKGVEITFNANELASTSKDLFGDQVEGAHQRIGLDLTDSLYALLTETLFPWNTIADLSGFARADLITVASEMNQRGVSPLRRFVLLSSGHFAKLQNDTSLVSLATQQRPELIAEYLLPRIAGLQPYESINLPSDNQLRGFAGTPDALVLATRVPNDYTQALPGANNGNVSVVTNPDVGISVQLVQYVDHALAQATWRLAYMWGVAKGEARAGQRIIEASTS